MRAGTPQPLGDRVLVKRIEQEESQRNGIFIPDVAKERPQEGEVLAVGEGRRNTTGDLIPVPLKEGDHVLFGKYSGTEIRLDDQEYLILREEEVLVKLVPRLAKRNASK